jgi:hypothetical protein
MLNSGFVLSFHNLGLVVVSYRRCLQTGQKGIGNSNSHESGRYKDLVRFYAYR